MASDGELRAAAKSVFAEFHRTQRQILRQPVSTRDLWLRAREDRHLEVMYRFTLLVADADVSHLAAGKNGAQIEALLLAYGEEIAAAVGRSGEMRVRARRRYRRGAPKTDLPGAVAELLREGDAMISVAEESGTLDRAAKRARRRASASDLLLSLVGVRLVAASDGRKDVESAVRSLGHALILDA